MRKKSPETKLKEKLWKIVSKRIKERDGNICFTSGKYVEGPNNHCGHMFPSVSCGALLRYHPKNLHCQSYFENINMGGNGAVYALNFIEKYGKKEMNNLLKLKQSSVKANKQFYEKLIEMYETYPLDDIEKYLNSLV